MKLDRLFYGFVILSTLVFGCEPGTITHRCKSPWTCPLPEPRPAEKSPEPGVPAADLPEYEATPVAPSVTDESGYGLVLVGEDGGTPQSDATPAVQSDAESTNSGNDAEPVAPPVQEDGGTAQNDATPTTQSDAEVPVPSAPPMIVKESLQTNTFVNGTGIVIAKFYIFATDKDAYFKKLSFRVYFSYPMPSLTDPSLWDGATRLGTATDIGREDANSVVIRVASENYVIIVPVGYPKLLTLKMTIVGANTGAQIITTLVSDSSPAAGSLTGTGTNFGFADQAANLIWSNEPWLGVYANGYDVAVPTEPWILHAF